MTHKEVVKAVYPSAECVRAVHPEYGDCWQIRIGDDEVNYGASPQQAWFLARIVLSNREMTREMESA